MNVYLKLHRFQIPGKHSDSATTSTRSEERVLLSLHSRERFFHFCGQLPFRICSISVWHPFCLRSCTRSVPVRKRVPC